MEPDKREHERHTTIQGATAVTSSIGCGNCAPVVGCACGGRARTTGPGRGALRAGLVLLDWSGSATSTVRLFGQPKLERACRCPHSAEAAREHRRTELVPSRSVGEV